MAIRNPTAAQRSPRRPPVRPLPPSGPATPNGAATPHEFTESERRRAMIAEAAYFRAAARGFVPGLETEDWLDAEREIDDRLFRGELGLS